MRRLLLFASMFVCTVAHADGAASVAADALFRDGRRAADAGNFAVACPKFEESYRLEPALGTLLSVADCEENEGHLARASLHFRQLYEQLADGDDRRPIVSARVRALEARVPKLRIVVTTGASVTVTRDDVAMGGVALSSSLPVDPGRHVVVVMAPGHQARRYEVMVAERDDKVISVAPGEPVDAKSPSSTVMETFPENALAARTTPDHTVQRTAAFVVGGVGVASLVAGGVFGVVALSNLSSANGACVGDVCSSQNAVNQFRTAQAFAVAADVGIGVGVVLIGTAVLIALTGKHHDVLIGARF